MRPTENVVKKVVHFLVGAFLLFSLPFSSLAHDAPPSVISMDIGKHVVELEIQLPVDDLAIAMGVSPFGLRKALENSDVISRYVISHASISTPEGRPFKNTVRAISFKRTSNQNWVSNDWIVVHAEYKAPDNTSTERMKLTSTLIVHRVLSHQTLVYVRTDLRNDLLGNKPMQVGVLAFGTSQLQLDGSGGSWTNGFAHMFALGLRHIIEGPDHLLFLFALLLSAPLTEKNGRWGVMKSWPEAVRGITVVVTGFTVGHSLTLALAAFNIITPQASIIEILIAASILISSIHAWRPIFARREIWIAIGFGFVHGLAFAEVLVGLNFDITTLVISLLGFNLGIEAMQILVISFLLPTMLLAQMNHRFGWIFRLFLAGFAAACALGWIAQRAFGLFNPMQTITDSLAPPPSNFIAIVCVVGVASTLTLIYKMSHRRIMDRAISALK